jgi:hypothetical protein
MVEKIGTCILVQGSIEILVLAVQVLPLFQYSIYINNF